MKTTAWGEKVGWGGWNKVLRQLFSLMCVVCHKGWRRWGGVSTSLNVNGLERVIGEFKVAGTAQKMGERLLSPVAFVMWSCRMSRKIICYPLNQPTTYTLSASGTFRFHSSRFIWRFICFGLVSRDNFEMWPFLHRLAFLKKFPSVCSVGSVLFPPPFLHLDLFLVLVHLAVILTEAQCRKCDFVCFKNSVHNILFFCFGFLLFSHSSFIPSWL